jgi:hypothetical protein
MNCQRARDVFPELLDHRTSVHAHADVRTHLASCPDCQREFAELTQTATALDAMPHPTPSPRLRRNFYAMLEEEKHSAAGVRALAAREHRARSASLWRWIVSPLAGCALLALGFTVGQRNSTPALAPAAPAQKSSIAAVQDDTTKQELAALKELITQQRQQLDKMTTLVGYSILQQQQSPANERLQDVLVAARSENASDKVLSDLVQALTLDPNANVRLRAIEALYAHAERNLVRAGVNAALLREANPLVQIELIDFVAAARDRNATPVLEKIFADESADRSVRDAAKLALAQL